MFFHVFRLRIHENDYFSVFFVFFNNPLECFD